jgi:hypothetical protein
MASAGGNKLAISEHGDSADDGDVQSQQQSTMGNPAPVAAEPTVEVISDTGSGYSSSHGAGSEAGSTYTFAPATGVKGFPSITGRDTRDWWAKWGLADHLRVCSLRYDQRFQATEAAAFLRDLLASPALRASLPLCDRRGGSVPLTGAVASVAFESVPATALSMDFFDRLASDAAGIVVGGSGYIKKKLEEEVDGVTIGDLLRDALLNEESEGWSLFSAAEREQLLFRLFKMVVTGGAMCQPEVRVATTPARLQGGQPRYRPV